MVIHYTAMKSAAAALNTLCNPDTQVSAHYLIAPDGEVLSLVPEDLRAWHAGAGRWGSVTDVNSRSIGIELANNGFTPFASAQMDALTELLKGIRARWDIRPERVIGHSDMAPGRKIDPGPASTGAGWRARGWPSGPRCKRLTPRTSSPLCAPLVTRRMSPTTCCFRASGSGSGPMSVARWTGSMPG